jgi:peroxiredoxin
MGLLRLNLFILTVLLAVSASLNVYLAKRVGDLRSVVETLKDEGRLTEGTAVPQIDTADVNGVATTVSFRGAGPTLLYVFSPQCGWCTRNVDNVKALTAQTQGRLRVVGLSLNQAGLAEHVAEHAFNFPVFVELAEHSAELLKVTGTPTSVLIDESGVVRKVWRGAYRPELQSELEQRFNVRLPGVRPALAPGANAS